MILLLGLQSCKTDIVEDYELIVLDEIFDELIEKTNIRYCCMSTQPQAIPPRVNEILDLVEERDTVLNQEFFEVYKKIINELKNDTTTKLIAVSDTLFTCYKDEVIKRIIIQNIEHGYIEAFNAMRDSSIKSRPLDLSKITKRERIALRYLSEFPETKRVLDISRIYFDTSLQYGLFYCIFMCGRLCRGGEIVCIRKIDDKWTIEEMISLCVS